MNYEPFDNYYTSVKYYDATNPVGKKSTYEVDTKVENLDEANAVINYIMGLK